MSTTTTSPTASTASEPTARLASFVAQLRIDDIPSSVLTRLEQCTLDFIAVTAAGAVGADSSPPIRDGVQAISAPDGPGTVIGDTRGYAYELAALLNGTFAHSLDFDDTNITSALHPGAPVIPAALAIAERDDRDGAEFLTALAAGYETCCRVGAAIGPSAYNRGFHPTPIAGIFGAVAAGGRLLHLSAEQLDSAFGLAGSMAAGSMQYLDSGAWNKRLHPGLAAHNALLALTFAASGVLGAQQALEGRLGVLHAYSEDPRPDWLTDGLGDKWVLAATGIKPYPSCRLTHGAIDAALTLRRRLGAMVPPGATFTLGISPVAYDIVGTDSPRKTQPETTVDGQFSVYFQFAVALLDGGVDWSSYQRFGAADVTDVIDRLTVVVDDDVPSVGAALTCARPGLPPEEVRIDIPAGEPDVNLPWDVVTEKFHRTAAPIFGHQQRQEIVEQTRALRTIPAVRSFAHLLRPGGRA